VKAAILGAEEFNFGTAALIALGCVYVRQCHLNTCPVGIATQDEKLRAKFKGSPDMLVNFFNSVAEEVRVILQKLGVRSLTEIIGRPEFLRQRHVPDHPKANKLDLKRLLVDVVGKDDPQTRYCTWQRNDPPIGESPLDDAILQDCKDAIVDATRMTRAYKVRNVHRSIGTKVSGEIGYLHGAEGLPEGTLTLNLRGSAGQSFGAFLASGIKLNLTGEGERFVGKGMSGGEIIVRPPADSPLSRTRIALSATPASTGDERQAAANGRAGERFAVRNSGATAVVEGVGDHGCEYMTGGTIVVLGGTGKNFGRRHDGGVAYVYDVNGNFEERVNPALVRIDALTDEDEIVVRQLIYQHLEATESPRARELLGAWSTCPPKVLQVHIQDSRLPADRDKDRSPARRRRHQ
jgi:glutamate synthase (NADPH/NADH) large chain/glutamate synthase (ferredoxin)